MFSVQHELDIVLDTWTGQTEPLFLTSGHEPEMFGIALKQDK